MTFPSYNRGLDNELKCSDLCLLNFTVVCLNNIVELIFNLFAYLFLLLIYAEEKLNFKVKVSQNKKQYSLPCFKLAFPTFDKLKMEDYVGQPGFLEIKLFSSL